mmetsp:Transcript_11159/g.19710  ORF Transcript_11159/g.19710 Transcript_11159/m.19710 type:complete len:502 (+) Transcript_11159:103-1608(+)
MRIIPFRKEYHRNDCCHHLNSCVIVGPVIAASRSCGRCSSSRNSFALCSLGRLRRRDGRFQLAQPTENVFHAVDRLDGVHALLEALLGLELLQFRLGAVQRQRGEFLFIRSQPRVRQGLLRGKALQWVHHEQLGDQVLRFGGHGTPVLLVKLVHARLDALKELILILVVERRITAQQDVQNHTQRPHIHRCAVKLVEQDFGRDIRRCAALLRKIKTFRRRCETKVHNLHVRIVVRIGHEKVLGLEVSVHDLVAVHVVERIQQHFHQITRLLLGVEGLLHDTVKEFTAIDLLQHEVKVTRLLEEVQSADNVGVVQGLQQLHLGADGLLRLGVQRSTRHDLDRDLQVVHLGHRGLDHGIASLAERVAKCVARLDRVWQLLVGLEKRQTAHDLLHLVDRLDCVHTLLEALGRLELAQLVQCVLQVAGLRAVHPGVRQGLLRGEALSRVDDEQLADQVLGLFGHAVPVLRVELIHSRLDTLKELFLVVVVERRVSTKQDVQNHAK